MPHARFFNPAGKEVFPPRAVNYDVDDADQSPLRIVIVPPGHFVLPEKPSQITTAEHVTPIIVGGAVPIVGDDAPHVQLPNGQIAQPVSETLQMPTFDGPDAFPEPIVDVVELDVSEQPASPVATVSLSNDVDEIRPPSRALTAIEQQALEDELEHIQMANRERLKGVRTISHEEAEQIVAAAEGRDGKRDNPARPVAQPPIISSRMPKHQWVSRRANHLIAVTGAHPADAERQAELEWENKNGR